MGCPKMKLTDFNYLLRLAKEQAEEIAIESNCVIKVKASYDNFHSDVSIRFLLFDANEEFYGDLCTPWINTIKGGEMYLREILPKVKEAVC